MPSTDAETTSWSVELSRVGGQAVTHTRGNASPIRCAGALTRPTGYASVPARAKRTQLGVGLGRPTGFAVAASYDVSGASNHLEADGENTTWSGALSQPTGFADAPGGSPPPRSP